jgi:hypothetical protein
VAKVTKFVTLFEKKKSKIGEIELEVTMLQELLRRMQEGGGFALHPLSMLHDLHYKLKPITINCFGTFTFTIDECLVCAQWFPSNDIFVASCGHTYDVYCMAYYGASHPCCKIADCKEEFHHNWLVVVEI